MDKKQIIILICIIVGLVSGIGIGIFSYFRHAPQVPVDKNSTSRLTELNNVLSSLFGQKWPFLMIGFAVFFLLLMGLLFLLTKKEYNLSDGASKGLTGGLIAFTIVFALSMIGLAVKAYRDQTVKENTGNIPNYIPSANERKRLNEVIGIVVVSLVLILTIGGIIFYHFHKKSVQ
jgi:hypothetical protein